MSRSLSPSPPLPFLKVADRDLGMMLRKLENALKKKFAYKGSSNMDELLP